MAVAPMPPEKSAYALARYSRSPDSIEASITWVHGHSSEKFWEQFYFDYGHASIADLGHVTVCFENISELAAIRLEDEQLALGRAPRFRRQPRFAARCREKLLPRPAVVGRDLRQQDALAPAATDDHSVLPGTNLLRVARRERHRLGQHRNLDLERRQLLGRHRRKPRILGRGRGCHPGDDFRQRPIGSDVTDTTAQLAVAAQRHERAAGPPQRR